MQPDRWRQIEDLFHAALEREPALRPAFLENACRGDVELHDRVAALLRQDVQGGALLSEPIEQVADDVLTDGQAEDLAASTSALAPERRDANQLFALCCEVVRSELASHSDNAQIEASESWLPIMKSILSVVTARRASAGREKPGAVATDRIR
jgi:hypothetical protein